MLTRVYCHNYKCLDNFEFRPAVTQLLLGRNGAGKSTVFEVLELIRDFAARGEDCSTRFAGKTRTRWQMTSEQRFELDVTGNGGSYTYALVIDDSPKSKAFVVVHEQLSFNGKQLYLFKDGVVHLHNDLYEIVGEYPILPRRSYFSELESRPDNTKLMWFKGWLDRLLYVQIDPKRIKTSADQEAVYPDRDLSNYAEWYRHLRQERSAATDEVRSSLHKVIDGFVALDLKGPPSGARMLQVAIETRPSGMPKTQSGIGKSLALQYFSFDELSDGQRTLIGLYTLLHCALTEHSTLCIDEPDNFIALAEIQPWLFSILDKAQETKSQLLFASHHPEVLNQLATDNGVIIERIDGGPARVRTFAPVEETTLTPSEIVARGWENA